KYDASGNEQWTGFFNGEGDNYDNANDIETDTAGNTYIAGYSVGLNTDRDMCIIKLNPNGDTLWVRKFNGTSNFTDEATAIKVDNAGNVYVTGFTKNSGTSYDYTTIKLNTNGDTLWLRKYNSPANESDKAWGIDIDIFGDVYVTGESDSDPSLVSNDDFCTVKYNASGVQQWVQRYNGTGNKTDRAVAIEVSIWGTAYVTGRSSNGTDDDIVTIQYTGAGVEQWVKKYNGGNGDNHPSAMTIDGWENVYVTGTSRQVGGLYDDYVTIKYNSGGTQIWAPRYDGTGSGNDMPKAILTDASGNVYVTGQSDADTSSSAENFNYLTVKYNSSGAKQWAKDYNGSANANDVAMGIVLDDSSNVYVTGQCDNGSAVLKNYDFATIKYNPSGTQQWYAVYNGPGNGSDGANAIAYRKGAVYAAGGSMGVLSQRDLTVLKYLCVPLGVDEHDAKLQIAVFPVPASQYLYINSTDSKQKLNISVLNILGEEVIKKVGQNSHTSIDVQNLEPGIYILKINDVYFKKIEILH
ncbi:MAG: T9SS type A sorting domain-containing protein, partial [Bacteroidales bacterium]|nr:T9SS type A sorting domain-containing protein [Bacteroidales bacterium]